MSRFFRLSGAGNDFLAVLESGDVPRSQEIARLCRRGISLGADGLFLLEREARGARLRHWNADGGPAELCVNGARCAARLAFHLGWFEKVVTLSTSSGLILARDLGSIGIEIEIECPSPPEERFLEVDGRSWRAYFVRVGVPHLVLAWTDELESAPVQALGHALRHHADLRPDGANVNFARFLSPERIDLRTYERGVETETLACGSGALATVAVGLSSQGTRLPVQLKTQGGCLLEVGPGEENDRDRWTLRGDARILAEGRWHSDAERAC